MFGQIQEIEIVPHADRQLVAHVSASPSLSSFLMRHKVPASGFLEHRTVNSVAFAVAIGTTGSDSIRAGLLLVGGDALQTRGSPWICIYLPSSLSIDLSRSLCQSHTHTCELDRFACNRFLDYEKVGALMQVCVG